MPRHIRDRSNRAPRVRRRRFCLTLNNPTSVECVQWNSVLSDGNVAEHAKSLTFFIVQSEREGTFHYQAYCEFKKAVSWSQLKKIFGDRIHIEESRGTGAANIKYCTKNTTRVTGELLCISGQWGRPKSSGGVTLAAIRIQNGDKLDAIVEDFPGVALMSMPKLEAAIAHAKGPRTEKPKVTILFGLTGCGKSQYCVRTFGTSAYWVAPPAKGQVWWGHYMCQDVCVFDDFHHGWFPLTELLRILDSTPHFVAPKGGQVPFNSGHLVFTCNVDPRDWYHAYQGDSAHKDALERRIQDFAEIIDCSAEYVGVPKVRLEKKVKRTNTFKFRKHLGLDFSIPAGVGDMSQGNAFNRF